jgi:methylated-DNA-[protein]-cysteine S-methyltransferase
MMSSNTTATIAYYSSPIGNMRLVTTDDALTLVSFHEDKTLSSTTEVDHPVLQQTIIQLQEYFNGSRKVFELPLSPEGTAFQQKVWQELLKIEYAATITYLQLARRLGNVKSIRAAASSNGKNPIAVIIPCHRVVGADGKLTGYAGGLHRKQWLLEHEAKYGGHPTLFGT